MRTVDFYSLRMVMDLILNHTRDYFVRKMDRLRQVKAHYSPKIKNIGEDPVYALQSVENFKILQQFDTLNNTANGVYASRLITHDLYNKTFSESDFDYNKEYNKQNHLEQDDNGDKRSDNGILPFFNYDKAKHLAIRTKGIIYYQSETSKVHDTHELTRK